MTQAVLFGTLVLSQLTNFAPIAAFLFFSNTLSFTYFIQIIFIAQMLAPVLTARMEVQIQVELDVKRQKYYLGLSFQTLLLTSSFILVLLLLLSDDTAFFLSLMMAVSLAAINIVRSFVIASGRPRWQFGFECVNILKNSLAIAFVALVSSVNIAHSFFAATALHAAIIAGVVSLAVPGCSALKPISSIFRRRFVAIKRARKILLFTFPSSFVQLVSGRLPILAIEQALPVPVASAFIAASRISLSPLSLVSYAIRVIGVTELNKRRRGLQNRFLFIFWSIVVAAPVILSPMLFSGYLKPLVANFDASWQSAIDYLPLMFTLSVFFIITGWMDRVFDVMGEQKTIFFIELGVLSAMLILSLAIVAGVVHGQTAIVLFVGVSIVQCTIWLFFFVCREFGQAGWRKKSV